MALEKRKKIVLLAIVVVVVAALALREPIAAWLAPASAGRLLTLSGNVEAHESVLGFKTVQSRIVQLPFNEGQWVKQGTVVAKLDDGDYAQQVAIAEANLAVQQRQLDSSRQTLNATHKTVAADEAEQAQRQVDFRRNAELRRQGFVSAAVLDQADTSLKQANAALARDRALTAVAERNVKLTQAGIHSAAEAAKLARIVQGYTTLTAPFDGVVTTRQAELGEVVVPGTPVITIADLDHVWLRAYVSETDLARVRLGQEVAVTTDSYPGKRYRGRLSFIAAKAEFTPKSVETHAERVTLVYRVKIDIDNPTHELAPGMPADATLELP
ncbi:MAG: efflux RND transporter periplasmic adaptor subunit [Rhodocyclaceae bacterium]|nr:efflux RND transporter periplasmic adaptor subunit [Rhodocyclaceae bacterium]